MSLIEEIGELSLVCAGLKAENEALRELVRDYSIVCYGDVEALARDYPQSASHIAAWQHERDRLQHRAKELLGGGQAQ